jgi:hypothetical protein
MLAVDEPTWGIDALGVRATPVFLKLKKTNKKRTDQSARTPHFIRSLIPSILGFRQRVRKPTGPNKYLMTQPPVMPCTEDASYGDFASCACGVCAWKFSPCVFS